MRIQSYLTWIKDPLEEHDLSCVNEEMVSILKKKRFFSWIGKSKCSSSDKIEPYYEGD